MTITRFTVAPFSLHTAGGQAMTLVDVTIDTEMATGAIIAVAEDIETGETMWRPTTIGSEWEAI